MSPRSMMHQLRPGILLVVSVLSSSTSATAAGLTRGRPTIGRHTLVSEWGTTIRGFSLSLGRSESHQATALSATPYADATRNGLNAVRLMIYKVKPSGHEYWNSVYGSSSGDNIDRITGDIDKCVENAARAGIYVVIDWHTVMYWDDAGMRRFWSAVALRYAGRTHVVYELCNEPKNYTTSKYVGIYKIVRQKAPQTMVISFSLDRGLPDPATVAKVASECKNQGVPMDFTKRDIVGYHGYGSPSWSTRKEYAATKYPLVCTEHADDGKGLLIGDNERAGLAWFAWSRRPEDQRAIAEPLFANGLPRWTPDYGTWPLPAKSGTTTAAKMDQNRHSRNIQTAHTGIGRGGRLSIVSLRASDGTEYLTNGRWRAPQRSHSRQLGTRPSRTVPGP